VDRNPESSSSLLLTAIVEWWPPFLDFRDDSESLNAKLLFRAPALLTIHAVAIGDSEISA
jgi:hypothetical protein